MGRSSARLRDIFPVARADSRGVPADGAAGYETPRQRGNELRGDQTVASA